MRLIRSYRQKNQNETKNRFKTSLSARNMALFFCLLFITSTIIPTYSAVVLAAPKSPKLPPAMQSTKSSHSAAVDVQTAKDEKASNSSLTAEGLSGPMEPASKPGSKHEEIASNRTETTKTFDTGGGQMEVRQYASRVHFKDQEGKWKQIDTQLVEDTNAAESTNIFGEAIAWVKGKTQDIHTYKVKANDWQAKFASSDDAAGMVRIQSDGKDVRFSPKNMNQSVSPVVTKAADGKTEIVKYIELWPEVDVVYTVKHDILKEEIILKSASAATNFEFEVKGATLRKNKAGGFDIEGSKQGFSELSVTLQKAGPTSEKVITQDFTNGILRIQLDKTWLKKQAANQFPVVIDPTWTNGPTVGWNYATYKSDGYNCSSSVCFMNAGTLYDNGWKSWRTVMCTGNIGFLSGKNFLYAGMYLQQANRSYLVGYGGDRYFAIQHASYFGYHGIDGGAPGSWYLINYASEASVTSQVQFEINRADWGPCWSLWGEEYPNYTYKGFDPDLSYMRYAYSTTPATPTVVSPQVDQTFTDPQVSFQLNPVGDADGEAVQYYFRIATGADGETGTVINSGDLNSTQWTVPDGVLQDGTTYYLHAYSRDPYAYSAPSAPIKFKIDMRRGKDKTQTADTVGPVSIDLATGNVSTSISSHDTTALGGSLGVSLDYNSSMRSRNGLVGQYWNNSNLSGDPVMTRVDKNIDFNWSLGSYSANQPADYFSARWSGYFIAPIEGDYYFGSRGDDGTRVVVKDQVRQENWNPGAFELKYGSPVNLKAGEAAKIVVEYNEYNAGAYDQLFVKGAVSEQIVPNSWLQTGVRPVQQNKGLQGRYYVLPAAGTTPNLDAADKSLFLSRVEPFLNLNWGTGSPVPNGAVDFMSRWEGYLSVPKTADYEFSTLADDGTKINIDGEELQNSWGSCCSERVARVKRLEAGKRYYIKVDHYDGGGPGSMSLFVRTTDNLIPKQIVPTNWLSPSKQVVPDGWQLGIDPDGNLSYERMNITTSSATLTDSSGDTHMYTWTGSGYKPPVNEDGQLSRNQDGTFTLIDTDGKTYTFKQDGQLDTVTLPTDDRKPAALKYEYSGGVVSKISDGVDSARNARVYYYGDGNDKCTTPSSSDFLGKDDASIANMLCALVTNDNRTTYFYYSDAGTDPSGKKTPVLGRVLKPGGEATDFQYTALLDAQGKVVGTQLGAVRDSLANDVVAASSFTNRANDDTTKTQLTYDAIGRAISVKAPAPTLGAPRQEQTIEYSSVTSNKWTPSITQPRGAQTAGLSMVGWGDNRLALFSRNQANNALVSFFQNGGWSEWQNLGGCIFDEPSGASWESGRIDMFVRGCDNQLYTRVYINGSWTDWAGLGGGAITSAPSATSWAWGRLDVVARGANNDLLHRAYTTQGGWSNFGTLGGCISQAPTASSWGPDRLNIYVQGCGSPTSFFAQYWSPGWSGFIQQSGEQNISSSIQSVSTTDRNIHVIVRGGNGALRYYHFNGYVWEDWRTLESCVVGSPAIATTPRGQVIVYKGCDGMLHQMEQFSTGTTLQHITGDDEPNKFTRKVEWDSTFRTVRDTDVTGKVTHQEWDSIKDLLLGTTDATGLKSTTIYDTNDMPVESFGPAPIGWFGTDRKPLDANLSQVPHTSTAYDENMKGLTVSWYDYRRTDTSQPGLLFGAPRLHTTGINTSAPGQVAGDLSGPPQNFTGTAGMQGFGFRGTGKLYLENGTYWVNAYTAEGVRVWVDDKLVLDSWVDAAARSVAGGSFTVNNPAGTVVPKRVRVEAYKKWGSAGVFNVTMKKDYGFDWTLDWSSFLKPDYGLQTSQTVFGAPTAAGQNANLTSRTNYGGNPELGLAQSVSTDAGGLNLTATSTYEPYNAAGSYLRQTSSSLPGGATTNYSYYGANETVTDGTSRCGSGKTYKQGGMLKLKTEPDPDGAGPQAGRTVETFYDDAGKVVGTRYNQDIWTCTAYDERERVLTTTVPAYGNQSGRTIVNDYAVGGNPLITSSGDASGIITVETDLLGRNVKYTDTKGNVTTSTYDSKGHLSQRVSKLGTEDFVYDNVDRLTDQKLDGVVFAHVNYDSFSRITDVTYPSGLKLNLTRESTDTGLGRLTGRTYTTTTGQTLSDSVTRAVTGDVTNGTELGQTKSYSYDTAGRLVAATVSGNTFTYGYGAQDTSCAGKPGVAADLSLAGKDSNRTSQTVNGAATTYCYDQADRLVSSSNALYDGATYDSHGNTTRLGSGTTNTNFTYDSSDRNVAITETNASGSITTGYGRDVQGRLTYRHQDTNGSSVSNDYYGYTASGDSPDFITDIAGAVTQKYLTLPGDVMVTIRPNRTSAGIQTFSLPNIHGDIFATVDADGKVLGTYQTGPFGETLPNQTTNWNTLDGASFGYVGQHEKLSEAKLATAPIQMGARVYIPGLGRFLSVDPMPGGTPNLYAYTADPVNEFDLDGNWPSFKSVVKWTTRLAVVASFVPGPVGMIGSGVAAVGYLAQGQKGKAAASLVGCIPGGALVSKVAAKSSMGTKLLTKAIDAQARSRGIGVNSKVFGYAAHGTSSFTNKVLPKVTGGYLRAGWAQGASRGSVAWRVGIRNVKPMFVQTSYKLKRFR